jgi:hypothetical protein
MWLVGGNMASTTFDPTMFDTASGRRLKKECGPCDPGAELTIIPEFLYFGYVQPGAVSDWQPLIIQNTGIVSVGVENLLLEGEFEIATHSPVLLVPGENATYSVRFVPQGNGARGGDIEIRAATAGKQPIVKLIGIGGEMPSSGEGGGGTPVSWAYRYGSFIGYNIGISELILDYHVSTAHRLQSNFAGCKFSAQNPPAEDYICIVRMNGTSIGTVTFRPDGSVSAVTNGHFQWSCR